MRDYSVLIRDCDSKIRLGRPQEVAHQLSQLNPRRVPREWRLPLAKICRRAGLHSFGIKLLASTVRPHRAPKKELASPGEIAEYAVLLFRIGAVTEALELLSEVDTTALPNALLYRAFGHFAAWDYRTAIPLLEKYIAADLPAYDLLVGRVNLAMAFVETGEYSKALPLLDANIETARTGGHLQAQSNCLVFRGQAYLQQEKFAQAKHDLEQAQGLFTLQQSHDHFTARKWSLILEGLMHGNAEPFAELRKLARERHDAEALRDADIFSLKVGFDLERFLHVYFGSPFPELRERLQKDFGRGGDRTEYVFGAKSSPRFDLRTGKLNGVATSIAGGRPHQLLEALLRDFYRPLQVAGLFSLLNPGERFDVYSSAGRTHELIRRTRAWLAQENIPVIIQEDNGFYSLALSGPFSFRIPLLRQTVDQTGLQISELKSHFSGSAFFSTAQAREKLGISTATAQRLLNKAIERGDLLRLGDSKRSALYTFNIGREREPRSA